MLKQLPLFSSQDALSFGTLKLDPGARKFFVDGKSIYLRNKEFTLMKYFMDNIGMVLSRTQLLEEVWDKNIFCSTNTVDVHVSTLRRKMRRYMERDFIKTVYCIGYIFDPSY